MLDSIQSWVKRNRSFVRTWKKTAMLIQNDERQVRQSTTTIEYETENRREIANAEQVHKVPCLLLPGTIVNP